MLRHGCRARSVQRDRSGVRSVTVTAIKVPAGVDGDAIRKKIRVERGFVLGGGQARLAGTIIRIGTMGDISQTDVLGMLGSLEMELLGAGMKIQVGSGVQAALQVFLEASQPSAA